MLTTLDLINEMVASTGTAPLTVNDTAHPEYKKGLNKLHRVLQAVLGRGWWFNTTYRTFTPNVSDEIVVPTGALSVDPTDVSKPYVVRAGKLFNTDTASHTFTEAVEVKMVDEVTLEDCPPPMQDYIMSRCVYEYYRDADGVGPKLSEYKEQMKLAFFDVRREHLKNLDLNFFSGTSYLAQTRRR